MRLTAKHGDVAYFDNEQLNGLVDACLAANRSCFCIACIHHNDKGEEAMDRRRPNKSGDD